MVMLEVRQCLAEAGAASACRRVLADHYKKNGEVVEEALALMRNLVAGDSTICREAIVKSDGIKMIINAMEENIENIQICVQGSLAIRNLACGDHKLLQALVDANGVQVLIQALKLHKPEKVGKNAQYAELTRAVCAALRNLAVDGWMAVARKYGMAAAPAAAAAGAQTAGAVPAMLALGGVEVIVEAMQLHKTDPHVQSQGCGMLRNLSCGNINDKPSSQEAVRQLYECGGLKAVLSAIRYNADDVGVVTQACGFLRNIATAYEWRGQLLSSGAVEAATRALSTHGGHREVCEQASACLANLLHQPLPAMAPSMAPSGAPMAAMEPPTAAPEPSEEVLKGCKLSWRCDGIGAFINPLLGRAKCSSRIAGNCCAGLASLLNAEEEVTRATHEAMVGLMTGPVTPLSRVTLLYKEELSTVLQAGLCLCRLVVNAHASEEATAKVEEELRLLSRKQELLQAIQRVQDRGGGREFSCEPGFVVLMASLAPGEAVAVAGGEP